MITAQGTLVTFDKRVLTVTQTGTFVLCKDYKHDKLTVLMEVHKDKPFTLLLLTKGKLLSINMATEVSGSRFIFGPNFCMYVLYVLS